MEVKPKSPVEGPAEWFTGEVRLDMVVQGPSLTIAAVHFPPRGRTAWHSHSEGQTLYVTEGDGLIQSRGEAVVTISSGDVVWTPADEWHWHGAGPDGAMTHLSITEGAADWGHHVTDGEYGS